MKCLGNMERDIGGVVETLVTYSDLYVDHAWFMTACESTISSGTMY
jgi:hypothetical protein